MSFNKFSDAIHEMGLKKTEAEIRKDYADAENALQSVKNMQADVLRINASTANLDADTRIKRIEEAYKSEEMQTLIEKAKKDMDATDAQIYYMLSKLPSEIANNNASAFYMQKSGELSEHQKAVVDNTATLLQTQNESEAWDLLLNHHYNVREREAGLNNQEYRNSTGYRFIDGASRFVGGVAAVVGAFLMGRKSAGSSTTQVKGSTIQTYSTPQDRFQLFGK